MVMSFTRDGQANAKKGVAARKTTSSSALPRGELGLQSTKEYDLGGFVVSDEENDSLGMPPIRRGLSRREPPTRTRKTVHNPPQQLGQPITAEDVMIKLNPLELEMLDRFMNEARKIRAKIMNDHGFARITTVFVDGVLQKFGIFLPTTEKEMSDIARDADRVAEFGGQFLVLCRKFAKEKEENFADADIGATPITRSFSQPQPASPFIDIADDDDDEDYNEGISDEDFEHGETSEYFRKDLADKRKEMWEQWEAGTSQAKPKKAGTSSRGRGGRGRGSKKPYARQSGGGTEAGARRQSGGTGAVRRRGGARGGGATSRGGDSASTRGSGPKPLW